MNDPAAELDDVAQVRAFNRFYTELIGVLQQGLVDTSFTLTEARVIFELAQAPGGTSGADDADVAGLRARLGLDAGYLSRILARLESAGLVERERSAADARRQLVRLGAAGRAEFQVLDRRSGEQVSALLAPLEPGQRRRLRAAMGTVHELLGDRSPAPAFVLREPHPGDLGWVVSRNGALYAQEYGWDETYEALVARIVADFVTDRDPARERAWIAEVAGEPAGCVFCVRQDDQTARLRLLLVDPAHRGLGIGARLVQEVLRFARGAGYRRLTLWTNDVLADARRIYQRAGFTLDREEMHTSFGAELVGQDWSREL